MLVNHKYQNFIYTAKVRSRNSLTIFFTKEDPNRVITIQIRTYPNGTRTTEIRLLYSATPFDLHLENNERVFPDIMLNWSSAEQDLLKNSYIKRVVEYDEDDKLVGDKKFLVNTEEEEEFYQAVVDFFISL